MIKISSESLCFKGLGKVGNVDRTSWEERDLLHEKFPDLSSLCKRSIDLKGSLGIDEDDFVLPKTKGEVAANPIGYTLRESTLRTSITIDLPPTTKPKPKSSGQLKRSREAAEL